MLSLINNKTFFKYSIKYNATPFKNYLAIRHYP